MSRLTDEVSSTEALNLVLEASQQMRERTVSQAQSQVTGSQPYLTISEQPQSRGFRFRYKCEGPSHGGIPGAESVRGRKSYPTVKICNYNGPARIMVFLVTEETERIHAHELVGRHCRNGIYVTEVKGGDMKAMFPNLGVMHTTKRNLQQELEERIKESMKCEYLVQYGELDENYELNPHQVQLAKDQASKISKSMSLSSVRLCFKAYLKDDQGTFTRALEPAMSDPIYDNKAPGAATLKICRMDKYGCSCMGGVEVFLLCEKVQKDDINVVFIERDDKGQVVWEDCANFGPSDVHRQYAIVFSTPPYHNTHITEAVQVTIQLKRQSDGQLSEPKAFTYFPQQTDREGLLMKRKKPLPPRLSRFDGMGPNDEGSSGGDRSQHSNMGGKGFDTTWRSPLSNDSTSSGDRSNENALTVNNFGLQGFNTTWHSPPSNLSTSSGDSFIQETVQSTPMSTWQSALSTESPFTHSVMVQSMNASSSGATVGSLNRSHTSQLQTIHSEIREMVENNLAESNIDQIMADLLPTSTTNIKNYPDINPNDDILNKNLVDQLDIYLNSFNSSNAEQTLNNMDPETLFLPCEVPALNLNSNTTNLIRPNVIKHKTLKLDGIFPFDHNQNGFDYDSNQHWGLNNYSKLRKLVANASDSSPQKIRDVEVTSTSSDHTIDQCKSQPPKPAHLVLHADGVDCSALVTSDNQVSSTTNEVFSNPSMVDKAQGGTIKTKLSSTGVFKQLLNDDDLLTSDNESTHSSSANPSYKIQENNPASSPLSPSDVIKDDALVALTDYMGCARNEGASESVHHPPETKKIEALPDVILPIDKSLKSAASPQNNDKLPSSCLVDSVSPDLLNLVSKLITALLTYAATGDVKRLLMAQRHLLRHTDDNANTVVHTAIIHGHEWVLRQILTVISTLPQGSQDSVNSYNLRRQTPLHLAVLTNQPRIVHLLLQQHAVPSLADHHGNTPCHLAAAAADDKCLKLLCSSLRPGRCPFPDLDVYNNDGLAPLHLAVISGSLACVQTLIAARVDADCGDCKHGRAALHYAVKSADIRIAAYLLLEGKVDVNAVTFDHNTPLHIACGLKRHDMVALLMINGADPDVENDEHYDQNHGHCGEETDDLDSCCEHCSGCRPINLAGDDLEIKRILDGETYLSFEGLQNEATTDTRMFMERIDDTLQELSRFKISPDSNQAMLDATTRMQVSALLDVRCPGQDWRALCEALHHDDVSDVFTEAVSPTRALLDHYEACGGSIPDLREALLTMNRFDAVAVIDGMTTKPSPPTQTRMTRQFNRSRLVSPVTQHNATFQDSAILLKS